MPPRILVYGATGYTGRLVAAEAARRGLDVVLAGRNPEKLKAVAEPWGFDTRGLRLEDGPRLRVALEDCAAVLHVAGPFSQTARPMVDACLETGTHYLDVTGEIDVFEALARRDAEARAAGIAILPGVGFDVVPSDCLAAHVAARVTEPSRLRLAIAGIGGRISRGTAKTAIESLGDGLRVRREGILRRRPAGSLERHFDFGAGPTRGIAMPWGDVSTAFHSTGVPDIEVYFILSGAAPMLLKASRLLAPLLRQPLVERFLKRRVDARPGGPSEAERDGARAFLLAEMEGADGSAARALLETPSGYALTPIAAIEAARRVAAGLTGTGLTGTKTGFMTPSKAFGADFILELDAARCQRRDLD